jgi:hypothetical protein
MADGAAGPAGRISFGAIFYVLRALEMPVRPAGLQIAIATRKGGARWAKIGLTGGVFSADLGPSLIEGAAQFISVYRTLRSNYPLSR